MRPKLLVCRLRADRCKKIQDNQWIRDTFGSIVTIDHYAVHTYDGKGFEASYKWPAVADLHACEELADNIIRKHGITHAIIGQKLQEYSNVLKAACVRHRVKFIWAEAFFDEKLVYDAIGLQYCRDNEIFRFVNKVPFSAPSLPRATRENQPPYLSTDQVYRKYGLTWGRRYIVIMGQLPWDMSLKQSTNPMYSGYSDFIDMIVCNNHDAVFLYKPHPKDNVQCRFGNKVTYVTESLDTLFNAFDKFVAYSSTTIFEGIIRRRKFATMGYHLCNSDKLVYQIKDNAMYSGIFNNLDRLEIDEEERN